MDPRVQAGARGGQGAKGWQQEESYGQRAKQDEPYNSRARQEEPSSPRAKPEESYNMRRKQDDSSASPKGKQPENPFNAQRRKQEDPIGQQKGRQEDLFAQKGKQEDLFAQRGRQGDSLDNRQARQMVERSFPMEEKSFTGSNQPFSQRGGGGGGGGGRSSFGDFLSSNEPEHAMPWNAQYTSVDGDSERHGERGHELTHNPTIQTMVKMVTMLNFMKVELGETKTLRSKEQWRAAGAEFIGTFLFVYIGCGSVVATGMIYSEMTPSRLVAIAVAHGLAISCLAGATGAISGGHLNPAVTLAFVVAGKENLVRAGLYVTAQLFGAIFGALFLKFSTPEYLRGTLGSQDINEFIYPSQGFLVEMILTFLLVFVIFGVAVDRRGPGVIAPLPIGFAVLVDHLVGVPYTGASMNPARSFGPALVSGYFGSAHLVYWVAPCFGATLASALYRYAFLEPAEAAARAAAAPPPG